MGFGVFTKNLSRKYKVVKNRTKLTDSFLEDLHIFMPNLGTNIMMDALQRLPVFIWLLWLSWYSGCDGH